MSEEYYSLQDHEERIKDLERAVKFLADQVARIDRNQASSAGRNDGGHSPPFRCDAIGPRQPTVKRETNPESPAEVCFGPSVPLHHPYPPVKYEWEIEE